MDALSQVLVPWLDIPFAFFGHSMGALIAFELARRLRRGNNTGPQQLLVASRSAPQKPRRQAAIYDLPEREFIEALHSRYNIPLTALGHGELMQLMMPMLRADFAICDTYEYLPEEPLNIQINAYGGLADREVTREELEAWENQTSGTFMLKMFPGDHFFLDSSPSLVTKAISDALEPPGGLNQLYPAFSGRDIG
jgi:medium-chain acyl-[acyl-carrier-protein] hydrolase